METLFYPIQDVTERLPLNVLFDDQSHPLEIELGCGDGSFLLQHAQAQPECNFIGLERLLGRIGKVDKRARILQLSNLRLIRMEASYFLKYLLPDHGVNVFHLYFPDPWPKRRHHKNRLVQAGFPDWIQRSLTPDGILYLRTDDAAYFEQMRKVFDPHTAFQAIETPQSLKAIKTDFEMEFNARGIETRHLAYRLVEAP